MKTRTFVKIMKLVTEMSKKNEAGKLNEDGAKEYVKKIISLCDEKSKPLLEQILVKIENGEYKDSNTGEFNMSSIIKVG